MTLGKWFLPAWAAVYFAIAIAATGTEVVVMLELIAPQPNWTKIGAIHAAVVVALLIYTAAFSIARTRAWAERRAQESEEMILANPESHPSRDFWVWCLAVAAALLGALGAGACLVAFALYLHHMRHSRPFDEWYAELFPERGRNLSERIYDELLLTVKQRDNPSRVVPFVDVISYGTRNQKQLAISMMSRYFQSVFAPVLKVALEDPNNSVRIQAATAIANLEGRFSATAMTLENKVEATPTPKNILDLAVHLDRYAYSGLLDQDRTARTREQALANYQRYAAVAPDDIDAHIAVGRLLMRSGQSSQAREWLAETRARLGNHPRLDAWLMEAHFHVRDLSALRGVAREVVRRDEQSGEIQTVNNTTKLWAGYPVQAEALGTQ